MTSVRLCSDRMCRVAFPCRRLFLHQSNVTPLWTSQKWNIRRFSCYQQLSFTFPVRWDPSSNKKILLYRIDVLSCTLKTSSYYKSVSNCDIVLITQAPSYNTSTGICNLTKTRHFKTDPLYSVEPPHNAINSASNVFSCSPWSFMHLHSARRLYTTSTKFTATLENIYSMENKSRVQERLLSVKPLRVASPKTLKPSALQAAVLVPLCYVNNEPSLLFMVRSKEIPKHRGEVWQV